MLSSYKISFTITIPTSSTPEGDKAFQQFYHKIKDVVATEAKEVGALFTSESMRYGRLQTHYNPVEIDPPLDMAKEQVEKEGKK